MKFNWEVAGWPDFKYDPARLHEAFSAYSERIGALRSLLSLYEAKVVEDRAIVQLANEAVDTSAIEGVRLDRDAVMSSVCRRLGRAAPGARRRDEAAEGFAALILDVRNSFAAKLTKKLLLGWHDCLFRGARGPVSAGKFRTHPALMVVLDGGIEGGEVRFVAPPSSNVEAEMTRFVAWFNDTRPAPGSPILHPAARIAIAHLYFECIHPFEDGNGRIGRMLVCKALAQDLGLPVLLPVSVAIRKARTEYYDAIHAASRTLDATEWCLFFTRILSAAMDDMAGDLVFLARKIQFFAVRADHLNPRQNRVLQRMAEAGAAGFAGGMNAAKYQKIAKTSKATATRDLADLVQTGALVRTGSGPSVRYHLPFTGGKTGE